MFKLILGMIATNRISEILVHEKIFQDFRYWLGISYDEYGPLYVDKTNPIKGFIGELLTCTSCTGVWVALCLGILYIKSPTLFDFIATAFTFSWGSNKLT